MTRKIQEDHKEFRDIIEGRVSDHIRKFIKTGKMITMRPKGDKFIINLPEIDLPTIRYGKNNNGWGRGKGEIGDIIAKDNDKKNRPGDSSGDTIPVSVDLKYVIQFLKEELELPDLKPKDNSNIFNERLIYNGIKKTGPESLRHTKKTIKNAMIRMIQTEEYNFDDPCIIPIQNDKRYRSWNIKKYPQSNAVIFFARDWSGSMNDLKCNIVVNSTWWLDCWIRQFYERTETVYIGHDTEAQEVDQSKFYKMRYGGGTKCSSAFYFIKEKIKYKFTPDKWNIYIFYFSDGENFEEDDQKVIDIISNDIIKDSNLIGIGQILHDYNFSKSLIKKIYDNIKNEKLKIFDYKSAYLGQEMLMIKHFLGKK